MIDYLPEKSKKKKKKEKIVVQVLLITSALGKQTKKRSVHSADTSR